MKEAKFIQHKLIPIGLIAANIAIGHLFYLLYTGLFGLNLAIVSLALTALGCGVLKANKLSLLLGIVAYSSILLFSLLA